MGETYVLIKEIWVVWFMLLFIGIVVWAFWPARRGQMEEHGAIPLRDDDNRMGARSPAEGAR